MRLILTIAIALLFSFQTSSEALDIIPQPEEVKLGKGQFTLTANTTIAADKKSAEVAQWLPRKIQPSTSLKLKKTSLKNSSIRLRIVSGKMGPEAYLLKVTANNVFISAGGQAGLLYACHSLLQLFPAQVGNIEYVGHLCAGSRDFGQLDRDSQFIKCIGY